MVRVASVSSDFLTDHVDCLIRNFCFYISAAGLVERVVLLGAPVSIKDEKWDDVRKVGS